MIQVDQLTEKASNSSGHSITLYNELSQLSGNQDVVMATDSPINPVGGNQVYRCKQWCQLSITEKRTQT